MQDGNGARHQPSSEELRRIVAQATENARLKAWRLKKLKERNELYLAARRAELGYEEEDEHEEEVTREL